MFFLTYSIFGVNSNVYTQNAWTQKADFGGNERVYATGFVIDSIAYLGMGLNVGFGNYFNDLWGYNTINNSWIQKEFLIGVERMLSVGFAIGAKGYLGTGINQTDSLKDFFEYSPNMSSIIELPDYDIFISPNPTLSSLIIELDKLSTIKILNMKGQCIYSKTSEDKKTKVDVSELPAGVYFVKVIPKEIGTNKNVVTKKIIKM